MLEFGKHKLPVKFKETENHEKVNRNKYVLFIIYTHDGYSFLSVLSMSSTDQSMVSRSVVWITFPSQHKLKSTTVISDTRTSLCYPSVRYQGLESKPSVVIYELYPGI